MSDTKTLLTLELATAHRERIHDLDRCAFTSIEPAAAALSHHKGFLSLAGITTLPEAAGKSLAKHPQCAMPGLQK